MQTIHLDLICMEYSIPQTKRRTIYGMQAGGCGEQNVFYWAPTADLVDIVKTSIVTLNRQ